jgi:uncharacterized protein YdcH (DUF465 family)
MRKIERLMDLHHPLLNEFPEYRDTILKLKDENQHFRQMFEEYHQIDDQVCRIEEDQERASDCELETLKMRRVILKDVLFHDLRVKAPRMQMHAMA